MLAAPVPGNESERLASLQRMLLLSTPDEESFDRVTRTAQRLFAVPIVLVSLIDIERQWFKSCIGLPVRETGRDVSFCGHAILENELFVIENALADERFADNPLVTGEPKVIFYAGRPLRNSEGFNIGTLCLIDSQPRSFSAADRRSLDDLGYWLEAIFLCRDLGASEQAMLQEMTQVRRQALLDPALNLWRQEAICDVLEREIDRAFRYKNPLSVFKIVINTFPSFVELGAAAEVQTEVARRLRMGLRSFDSLGVLGDAEFLVVMPETDAAMARQTAARLCNLISDYPMLHGEAVLSPSISLGGYSCAYTAETPDASVILEAVDKSCQAVQAAGGDAFFIEEAGVKA